MESNTYWNEVDKKISAFKKTYAITQAVKPINEKEEKAKFFKNKERNDPKFEYNEIVLPSKKQINHIKDRIKEFPDREIYRLYKEVPSCLRNEINLLSSLNTRDFVKYSVKIYGKPKKKYVKIADEIASIDVPKDITQGIIKGETLKDIFRDMLHEYYKVNDWNIILSNNYTTTVYPHRKIIEINKDRLFSIEEVKRLINHEINVHVLRAINGSYQSFKILSIGLPKYLLTEEGLAVYMEFKSDIATSLYPLKLRAARLLSVNMMLEGYSFVDTYHEIKEYGFNKETTWDIVTRVFRGGGLTKDHVYFQGYYEVQQFLEKDEHKKLIQLYIGKIGLQHIEIIQRLKEKGYLNEPKILPEVLKENIQKSS